MTVIDTTGTPPKHDQTIIIQGQRIQIVDLNQRQVEVYSQPNGDQYQKTEVHQKSLGVLENLTISPDDIFPKNS
ncbi:MAG: hypothetical protein AAGE93_05750 [Bacteroidota bacterium]